MTRNVLRYSITALGAGLLFLIMLTQTACPQLINARRSAWESRAKGTLRSIGSSQLAYQGTNEKRVYGTFEALKNDLYIAEGYTLENMVENYRLTWWAENYPVSVSERYPGGLRSSFTVIAWPMDTRPGYLKTFGITEDQVVRQYNPDNGLEPYAVKTWDPIL